MRIAECEVCEVLSLNEQPMYKRAMKNRRKCRKIDEHVEKSLTQQYLPREYSQIQVKPADHNEKRMYEICFNSTLIPYTF